jgi:predicted dehydrogenase
MRIRIAAIGAGGIAQQMHLPHLASLHDRFEVAGVCDVSPTLARQGAARFGASVFTDHRAMLDALRPDAVLIAVNGPSEDISIDALKAGAHVFVEKPMAWTPADAARVEAAVERSGRVLQIGYMKRFDPAVELAQRLVAEMGPIRGGVVRCVAGPNELYVRDVASIVRADDVPALPDLAAERVSDALGEDCDPELALAYRLLLGITCHELSVLRALVGAPLEVSSAQVWDEGRWLLATLRYPHGSLTYALGRLGTRTFDERVELYAFEESLELSFPSPFLAHAPTRVIRRRDDGAVSVEQHMVAGYEEAFRRELEHFHDCVAHGAEPRTPASEGRADAEILLAIARAARDGAPQSLEALETKGGRRG